MGYLDRTLTGVAVGLVGLLAVGAVQADTLNANISFYSISSSDPDANHLCCTAGSVDEVQNSLGPDNLPLLLPGFTSGGNTPLDVNAAGELTYWSPSMDPFVTYQATQAITLPYDNPHMYNPLGMGTYDGGSNGFLSAIISATLTVDSPETVTFSLASDDNAFVYLNGQVVCDDGGVHGPATTFCTSETLDPGINYNLLLFYDDLNITGAVLDFDVETSGVTTVGAPLPPPPGNGNEVPEPASLWLVGGALLALRLTRRSAV